MEAREILDKLIQSVDNVRAEFTYTDDIDRNIELQVNVALLSLKELVLEMPLTAYYNQCCQLTRDDTIDSVAELFGEEKK